MNYIRPQNIADALAALNPKSTILAGGTALNAAANKETETLIDLQSAGLDKVILKNGRLHVGAMVRLQTLHDDDHVPPLIKSCVRYEGPNTFRNQATLGGVVATADWESELAAALLVHEAEVVAVSAAGEKSLALADFWATRGTTDGVQAIITQISFAVDGQAAAERTARTPMDKPIVSVLGRVTPSNTLLLAACGAAHTPILIDPAALPANPPADFRGSTDYRAHLLQILTRRVLDHLQTTI